MRDRLACLVAAAMIVASCGSAEPSTSPERSSAAATAATNEATPQHTPSPLPTEIGSWKTTGMMAVGRLAPHALLADGNVLVFGNDTRTFPELDPSSSDQCVRDDSRAVEIWDRDSDSWMTLGGLSKPRADFVAVPLQDGRVLVTGGVNAGITSDDYLYAQSHDSYSSTYIYNGGFSSIWSKGGLLGTARTAPAAAALPDGRVLVAGGYYISAADRWWFEVRTDGGFALAADRRVSGRESAVIQIELADVDPGPPPATALATAELYDPATDTWSATSPLRFARFGAAAVALADGRVLVVGSSPTNDVWDHRWVDLDDRAQLTAEIYDPGSGRFSLTGELPGVDWTAVAGAHTYAGVIRIGSLVALAGGGALLVGRTEQSEGAFAIRSLRFDAASGAWTEIDRVLYASPPQTTGMVTEVEPGHSRMDMLAASSVGGQVLLAGGAILTTADSYETTAEAVLFDPETGQWTAAPPMPEPRAGGAAVTLGDGAVLLVGGYTHTMPRNESCSWGATGLTSAVLFIPGS
jgi:hypothetical protein